MYIHVYVSFWMALESVEYGKTIETVLSIEVTLNTHMHIQGSYHRMSSLVLAHRILNHAV